MRRLNPLKCSFNDSILDYVKEIHNLLLSWYTILSMQVDYYTKVDLDP